MHIWINQGFSSQRDVAHLMRQSETTPLLTVTHKDYRPEITGYSDFPMLPEPKSGDPIVYWDYVQSVIAQSAEKGAPLDAIVAMRQRFNLVRRAPELAEQGIRLAAGSTSAERLDLCEDKYAFTLAMENAGVPVPRTIKVETSSDVLVAIDKIESLGFKACIKPSIGVYGAGFWIFDRQAKPFTMFSDHEYPFVHPHFYADNFAGREDETPYIVMQCLPGLETSVDAVCEKGKILSHACRTKLDNHQIVSTHGKEYELASIVAETCQLDGLVNIQFKRDEDDQPRILEVNTRASGGFSYASVAGINLAADLRRMLAGEKIDQVHMKDVASIKTLTTPYLLCKPLLVS